MADVVDQTQDRETPIEAQIAASRRPVGPEATGHCLSCAEPVPANYRWCDSDCWTDWDKAERAAARAGRR